MQSATSSLSLLHCASRRPRWAVWWIVLWLLASSGCALQAGLIPGPKFDHFILTNPAARDTSDRRPLHVYLDGDGRAFLDAVTVASDPTPHRVYSAGLLAKDPGPAVLLGRPCYHGQARGRGCDPRYWTDWRYSEAVVDSLVAVLPALAGERDVVLIGHSGGGTLAMLVAQQQASLSVNSGPRIRGVVTIAANLDVAAWAHHHGYTPLGGSLDPASRLTLSNHLPQLHFFGTADQIIPATLSRRLQPSLPLDSVRWVESDHTCCWVEQWPRLLARASLHLEKVGTLRVERLDR